MQFYYQRILNIYYTYTVTIVFCIYLGKTEVLYIMEKFEYKILAIKTNTWSGKIDYDDFENKLNEMGQEGWELVVINSNSLTIGIDCVLKRKI